MMFIGGKLKGVGSEEKRYGDKSIKRRDGGSLLNICKLQDNSMNYYRTEIKGIYKRKEKKRTCSLVHIIRGPIVSPQRS